MQRDPLSGRSSSKHLCQGSSVTTSVLNYCAVLAFMCICQAFQMHFMGHGCSLCVYNYGSWQAVNGALTNHASEQ